MKDTLKRDIKIFFVIFLISYIFYSFSDIIKFDEFLLGSILFVISCALTMYLIKILIDVIIIKIKGEKND